MNRELVDMLDDSLGVWGSWGLDVFLYEKLLLLLYFRVLGYDEEIGGTYMSDEGFYLHGFSAEGKDSIFDECWYFYGTDNHLFEMMTMVYGDLFDIHPEERCFYLSEVVDIVSAHDTDVEDKEDHKMILDLALSKNLVSKEELRAISTLEDLVVSSLVFCEEEDWTAVFIKSSYFGQCLEFLKSRNTSKRIKETISLAERVICPLDEGYFHYGTYNGVLYGVYFIGTDGCGSEVSTLELNVSWIADCLKFKEIMAGYDKRYHFIKEGLDVQKGRFGAA